MHRRPFLQKDSSIRPPRWESQRRSLIAAYPRRHASQIIRKRRFDHRAAEKESRSLDCLHREQARNIYISADSSACRTKKDLSIRRIERGPGEFTSCGQLGTAQTHFLGLNRERGANFATKTSKIQVIVLIFDSKMLILGVTCERGAHFSRFRV